MKKINLKAFTLIELIVVLLMFSVIVSMGLIVTNLIKFNFNSLQTNSEILSEIQDKNMRLSSHFYKSRLILFQKDTEKLVFEDLQEVYLENQTLYESDEKIVFDSVFNLRINFLQNDKGENIVSCFMFSIIENDKVLPFTFNKEYDISTKLIYTKLDSLIIE